MIKGIEVLATNNIYTCADWCSIGCAISVIISLISQKVLEEYENPFE